MPNSYGTSPPGTCTPKHSCEATFVGLAVANLIPLKDCRQLDCQIENNLWAVTILEVIVGTYRNFMLLGFSYLHKKEMGSYLNIRDHA